MKYLYTYKLFENEGYSESEAIKIIKRYSKDLNRNFIDDHAIGFGMYPGTRRRFIDWYFLWESKPMDDYFPKDGVRLSFFKIRDDEMSPDIHPARCYIELNDYREYSLNKMWKKISNSWTSAENDNWYRFKKVFNDSNSALRFLTDCGIDVSGAKRIIDKEEAIELKIKEIYNKSLISKTFTFNHSYQRSGGSLPNVRENEKYLSIKLLKRDESEVDVREVGEFLTDFILDVKDNTSLDFIGVLVFPNSPFTRSINPITNQTYIGSLDIFKVPDISNVFDKISFCPTHISILFRCYNLQ